MTTDSEPVDEAHRQRQLANAVQQEVARGWRVESQGPTNAILRTGKRPNHVLHLLLSIFTLGVWLIVWLFLAVVKHEKAMSINVDPYGNVLRQKL